MAIIDQVLAANGAYFIGTESSTFSTVIMEERELAGMLPETTWNVLCGTAGEKADGPSGEAGTGCSIPRRQVVVVK